jgi:heme/copper-type cytochrome/quinol oxidase subunit 2
MLLNFYIASVIITLLSLAGAMYSLRKYIKANYTKEQMKIANPIGETNPFIFVVFFIPLFNLILAYVSIFEYDSILETIKEKFDTNLKRHELEQTIENTFKLR